MPVKTVTSGLFAKYGNRLKAAIERVKDRPANPGFQRLPPGITNGVAKLFECKIDTVAEGKNNAGSDYFRAAGTVVSPRTVMHDGQEVNVLGGQTSIIYSLSDKTDSLGNVTQSFEDNVARIVNELKLLGGNDLDVSDLDAACEAVKAAALDPTGPGIHFKFSTTSGRESTDPITKKARPPMVFENWHGTKGLEEYVPADARTEMTTDETAETVPPPVRRPAAAQAVNGTAKAPSKPAARPAAKPAPAPEPEPPAEEFTEFNDLDSLLARADDDEAAQDELLALAVAAGIDDGTARKTKTWAELVDMIRSAGTGPDEQAQPEEVVPPKAGDVYLYRPVHPVTKRAAAKAVEVEIKRVDAARQTVDLLNNTDKKTAYKGVPWDRLEGGEES